MLSKPAKPVSDIKSVHMLAEELREAMRENDGIGIAAPQIGEPFRIFLVAKELLAEETRRLVPSDVFINPKIVKKSFKRNVLEEGCLSVPGVFGNVPRSVRVTAEAYDLSGNKFRVAAEGLLAQIFQHEMDHLEGVLFVEKAKKSTLHRITEEGKVEPWKF